MDKSKTAAIEILWNIFLLFFLTENDVQYHFSKYIVHGRKNHFSHFSVLRSRFRINPTWAMSAITVL